MRTARSRGGFQTPIVIAEQDGIRVLTRFFWVLLLFSMLASTGPLHAAQRFALIIGNGEYDRVGLLENPKNDARALADQLKSIGFETRLELDLTREAMYRALSDFHQLSAGAEVAFVYFAGHGIEVDGRNYLIPTDAHLKNSGSVRLATVPLEDAVAAVEGATGLQLVIVDACRDNPFLKELRQGSSTRSIGRGLAEIEPPANTLVAYATKAGTIAYDGASDTNSPYAAALVAALRKPGLEIGKFFRVVRDDVIDRTGGLQEPFVYGSLSSEDFFLHPPDPSAAPDISVVSPGLDQQEIDLWIEIARRGEADGYRDYIARYPGGSFADLAAIRLSEIEEKERIAVAPAELKPDRRDDAYSGTYCMRTGDVLLDGQQTGRVWCARISRNSEQSYLFEPVLRRPSGASIDAPTYRLIHRGQGRFVDDAGDQMTITDNELTYDGSVWVRIEHNLY